MHELALVRVFRPRWRSRFRTAAVTQMPVSAKAAVRGEQRGCLGAAAVRGACERPQLDGGSRWWCDGDRREGAVQAGRERRRGGVQVARSRMQQRLTGARKLAYKTMPRAFVSILRKGGFTALYSGFAANAARVCPQAALQFFLYEQARRLLG